MTMIANKKPGDAMTNWDAGADQITHQTQRMPAVVRNICPIFEALIEQANTKSDVRRALSCSKDMVFGSGAWTQIQEPSLSQRLVRLVGIQRLKLTRLILGQ